MAFTGKPELKISYSDPQLIPELILNYVPPPELPQVSRGSFVMMMPEKDFLKLRDSAGVPQTIGGKGVRYFLPENALLKRTFLEQEKHGFYIPEAGADNVRRLAYEMQSTLNAGLVPVFCLPGKTNFPLSSSKPEFIAAAALIKLAVLSVGCGLRVVRNDFPAVSPKMMCYNIDVHHTSGREPDRFAYLISGYFSLMKTRKKPGFYDNWDAIIKNLLNAEVDCVLYDDQKDLPTEIENLPAERTLFIQGDFRVFMTTQKHTPGVLGEIGRLREISFREVGEGTGKETDPDDFDSYYEHLVLWDYSEKKIAGSYRLGFGDEILKNRGIKGFYTRELFYYEPGFEKVLAQAIELGRSFIVKDYRGKRLPLFLLWKGIYKVLAQKPEMRYLLGAASISSSYSSCSRKIMVDYLRENFEDQYLASFVSPALPCRLKLNKKQQLAADFHRDYVDENPEELVKSMNPDIGGFPVLIKRYLQQNARVLGVNVDVNFSNSIDVLMLLDKESIPGQTCENFK